MGASTAKEGRKSESPDGASRKTLLGGIKDVRKVSLCFLRTVALSPYLSAFGRLLCGLFFLLYSLLKHSDGLFSLPHLVNNVETFTKKKTILGMCA
ncbi:hypothetical protein AVEN_196101-1 [Araneus ventricosus]|uniref:Uncharacterized protein n=1 Tax=Araneus ventricosus TaxID=182803 RepID=A0A4Y2HKB8_ARAVE|nr:hypothetical protein AVEN_196101-1 [Araneus ventricosus]